MSYCCCFCASCWSVFAECVPSKKQSMYECLLWYLATGICHDNTPFHFHQPKPVTLTVMWWMKARVDGAVTQPSNVLIAEVPFFPLHSNPHIVLKPFPQLECPEISWDSVQWHNVFGVVAKVYHINAMMTQWTIWASLLKKTETICQCLGRPLLAQLCSLI